MEKVKRCLIIGASSELALGVIKILLKRKDSTHEAYEVYAISSKPNPIAHENLNWIQCIYTESEIAATCNEILNDNSIFDNVLLFNGQLHMGEQLPEKRIQDLNPEYFQQLFTSNTLIPMLFLKHIVPKLPAQSPCKVLVLSARVGSIQDNRLGGWFSYRSSKAALNMMVKSLSIETARKSEKIKFILYHPGTTNTALSKPFQQNVPEHQLFTTQQSAHYLLSVLDKQKFDGQLSYVDWHGGSIDW